MSIHTKNPIHPSALSLNDIRPGRRVIMFNREQGITNEGFVVSKPYMADQRLLVGGPSRYTLFLGIRSVSTGDFNEYLLSNMGVIPYYWPSDLIRPSWNRFSFIVDARKRHLLPEPDVPPLEEYGFEQDYSIYDRPYS